MTGADIPEQQPITANELPLQPPPTTMIPGQVPHVNLFAHIKEFLDDYENNPGPVQNVGELSSDQTVTLRKRKRFDDGGQSTETQSDHVIDRHGESSLGARKRLPDHPPGLEKSVEDGEQSNSGTKQATARGITWQVSSSWIKMPPPEIEAWTIMSIGIQSRPSSDVVNWNLSMSVLPETLKQRIADKDTSIYGHRSLSSMINGGGRPIICWLSDHYPHPDWPKHAQMPKSRADQIDWWAEVWPEYGNECPQCEFRRSVEEGVVCFFFGDRSIQSKNYSDIWLLRKTLEALTREAGGEQRPRKLRRESAKS